MKHIIRLAAAILAAAMLFCGSAFATSYSARVLSEKMTVYAAPDASSARLNVFGRGTLVKVTSIHGNWAKVSCRGGIGYAYMKNLIFDKRIRAVTTGAVTATFVTKTSFAKGTAYRSRIDAGTTVYVVGYCGNRALIEDSRVNWLAVVPKNSVRKIT